MTEESIILSESNQVTIEVGSPGKYFVRVAIPETAALLLIP